MNNYSHLREKLSLIPLNGVSEELALLTHFYYNYKKDEEFFYEEKIKNFYKKSEFLPKSIDKIDINKIFPINWDIPFPSPKEIKFTFIDLFSGVGGFRLALQDIGGRCVFSSENNKYAQQTYEINFGEVPFGDITSNEIKNYIPKNFDILCAGFPCQSFSIAGYKKGFSDTRGTLFFDIEQIINKHRPKVIFLENVKNLISHDNGNTFKIIKETLETKLKYKVYFKVLNTMTHANIPQNRERVFIIAFDPSNVENYNKFKFPENVPLNNEIESILNKSKQEDKYYYNSNHKYYPELESVITKKETVYQWRRVYVRENKNNVCPTLTANMGTGGHNVPIIKDKWGIRKLTPKECFAFQGFPIEKFLLPKISDTKLYTQAGNSVSVPLIVRIGNEIKKIII